jgi:hypothetical protein
MKASKPATRSEGALLLRSKSKRLRAVQEARTRGHLPPEADGGLSPIRRRRSVLDVLRKNAIKTGGAAFFAAQERTTQMHRAKEFSHALSAGSSHLLIPSLLGRTSTSSSQSARRQHRAMQGWNIFERRHAG